MPDPGPRAVLLRSLARLVRGLSALFWALPATLLASVHTGANESEWFRSFGAGPPVLANGLLIYGLWQLGHFQAQERPWTQTLERARLLAVANLGLSPFLFWWNVLPGEVFYIRMVGLLAVCSFLFLIALNHVLDRLSSMLPDETLRLETKMFTRLNFCLLMGIALLILAYLALGQAARLPRSIIVLLEVIDASRRWLFLFLILLPLAMTMALIWKIKEVVLASVFSTDS